MKGGPDTKEQDRFTGRYLLHGSDEECDGLQLIRLDFVVRQRTPDDTS
jgi:hypothetical protein